MPSSPESGPSRTSTPTCSTSRRASETALSGVASEHPKESLIGWPPTETPETPLSGDEPWSLPPRSTSASLAPKKDSFSKTANGPPQVVRIPILIGFAALPAEFAADVRPAMRARVTALNTATTASEYSPSRCRLRAILAMVPPHETGQPPAFGRRLISPLPPRHSNTRPSLPLPALIRRHFAAGLGLATFLFAVAWVANKAFGAGFAETGNVPEFVIVGLNGVTLAGLYFIGASGFTLIFGLMRVVNLAHGSLYLFGAYIALELASGVTNWWLATLVAALCMAVLGLSIQQVLLRWNLGQELRQALITIALSIILADVMLHGVGSWQGFGALAETITPPASLARSVDLGVYGLVYPLFRLAVLGAAVVLAFALWVMIQRTRLGMAIRAGVDDRAMASALGLNIQLVFAVVFFLGSALAGLGGALG